MDRRPGVAVTIRERHIFDGDRITCPGGTVEIDIASDIVMRDADRARALAIRRVKAEAG